MTDRPILMQPDMVLATLDGRKTNTRRVLVDAPMGPGWFCEAVEGGGRAFVGANGYPRIPAKVRFAVGDRLYVREAWRTHRLGDFRAPRDMPELEHVYYNADKALCRPWDAPFPFEAGKFRQGMHMPRWASRLTLLVTDVQVQRIQHISRADAIAEGLEVEQNHHHGEVYKIRNPKTGGSVDSNDPVKVFSILWDQINANRGFGWEKNPWVVAVTYKAHRCNIDLMESRG